MLKSLPVLLCALLSLSLVACPASKDEDVNWALESRYQRGNAAFARGEKAIAETEYRAVLEGDPRHPGALCKLARVLLEKAEAKTGEQAECLLEAGRLLDKAVKVEPQNIIAWMDLARVRKLQGDRAGSIKALDKVLDIKPDQIEALLEIVAVEQAAGNAKGAEQRLLAGLKSDHQGQLHLALARLLIDDKRQSEAEKFLSEITMCPPKEQRGSCPTAAYYESRELLGRLAVEAGKLDEARKIYMDMVRVFPDDYMAWEILAALDERESQWSEAEKKYRQSLELDRMHMSGWRGLGRVLLAQDKQDEARYALRKADGLLRSHPAEGLGLAHDLLKLGDAAWARDVMERSKVLLADDPESMAKIDRALESLGKNPSEGGKNGESGK